MTPTGNPFNQKLTIYTMNQITVFIKGHKIRLYKNQDKYRPNPDDLAHCADLDFLCTDEINKRLFQYFLDGRFSDAVKYSCYHADVVFGVARVRLFQFLLASLSCLISFNISKENMDDDVDLFREWISGLNCTYYTNQNILDLIVSEGYEIERQF